MSNSPTPYSQQAEDAVIGGILISSDAFGKIYNELQVDDFHDQRNQDVWQAALDLYNSNNPIDYVTIAERLQNNGKLKEVGGDDRLTALLQQCPNILNIENYAKIVLDKSRRRKLKQEAQKAAQIATVSPTVADSALLDHELDLLADEQQALNEILDSERPISAFRLDDIGNGERMATRHGHKVHYVKEWGWLIWNGKYWQSDRGEVARMAKETARSIFLEAAAAQDDERVKAIAKHASASANQHRRDAMITSCESEPGIALRPSDFDSDPWLLNCQNGILNLRTGELMAHDPGKLMTKTAGTIYDPAATCPRFLLFLDQIFAYNHELIAFINRSVGYSLTGSLNEQCLFFLHGIGKNGKSVFTGILQALMGDYGLKTLSETLMLKSYDNGINNDVARLVGSRLVVSSELAEDKKLNENLIKDMTGKDVITARYLHKEYFDFKPLFKLWMYGNHKPIIKGTDDAIWRRIKLIPFNVVIPDDLCDPNLLEKLHSELPGILAWAVRGCLIWQQEGLRTPQSVSMATEAYRAEQDTLGRFLESCCVIQLEAKVTSGVLYDAYKNWGGDLSQRRFGNAMIERGFKTEGRDTLGRALYHGIGLLSMG